MQALLGQYLHGATDVQAGDTFIFLGLTGQFTTEELEREHTTFTVKGITLRGEVRVKLQDWQSDVEVRWSIIEIPLPSMLAMLEQRILRVAARE